MADSCFDKNGEWARLKTNQAEVTGWLIKHGVSIRHPVYSRTSTMYLFWAGCEVCSITLNIPTFWPEPIVPLLIKTAVNSSYKFFNLRCIENMNETPQFKTTAIQDWTVFLLMAFVSKIKLLPLLEAMENPWWFQSAPWRNTRWYRKRGRGSGEVEQERS